VLYLCCTSLLLLVALFLSFFFFDYENNTVLSFVPFDGIAVSSFPLCASLHVHVFSSRKNKECQLFIQ
jgi:hypothetical protein